MSSQSYTFVIITNVELIINNGGVDKVKFLKDLTFQISKIVTEDVK